MQRKHMTMVAMGLAAGLIMGGAGGYFGASFRQQAACEEVKQFFGLRDPAAEQKRYEEWRKNFEENRRRQDEAARNLWKAK